ncbi:DUF7481 family protein [Sorangium sp. So ce363]|uniref:DUF7481 family protein n=1 Tax=Sorangium sp. So ce363 TaxID=3133304 RepID=UPI003F61FE3B
MRMRDVVSALLGGGAIYLAMAACAASEKGSSGHPAQQTGGGSGQGAEGGATAQQTGGGSGQGAEGGATAQQTGGGSGQGAEGGAHAQQTAASAGAHGNGGNGGFGGFMDPVPDASADPVSGSRLKARYRTTADGAKVYDPSRWFDSERRETCSFFIATDGQERCIPGFGDGAAIYQDNVFADSSCTQAVAFSLTKGCAPKYAYQTFQANTACEPSARIRLFSVGARLNPTSIYTVDSTGACKAQTPTAAFDYFPLGDEIPPSSFVATTWSVDP